MLSGGPHRTDEMAKPSVPGPASPNQPLISANYEAACQHLPGITQSSIQRGAGGGMPGWQLRFLSHSRRNPGENSGPGTKMDRGAAGGYSPAPRFAHSSCGLAGDSHGVETSGLG